MNKERKHIIAQLDLCGVPQTVTDRPSEHDLWTRIEHYAQNHAHYKANFMRAVFGQPPLPLPTMEQCVQAAEVQLGVVKVMDVNNPIGQIESMLNHGRLLDPAEGMTLDNTPTAPAIELTNDQQAAWAKLQAFVEGTEHYFKFRGYSGTGKTFLMRRLQELRQTFVYTAPTNKAAKELQRSVGQPTKTTYAALGLRMTQDEDGLRLTFPPKDKIPYFRTGTILVIDEAGMVGSELYNFVEDVRAMYNMKVIYVGDPLQLNPIGEPRSPAWRVTKDPACSALLREVKRFDNQLLTLSVKLRDCIKEKNWTSPLRSDHDERQGIWMHSPEKFERLLVKNINVDTFKERKALAWRNRRVNHYNALIREALGFRDPWCVNELLLIGGPVQIDDTIVANTDDEGRVTHVATGILRAGPSQVEVAHITLDLDDRTVILNVPTRKGDTRLQQVLQDMAKTARESDGRERALRWRDFWETKNQFHACRYANALTAHRIQGSTITEAFVDQEDILANPNKREAFRALYVCCTRPSMKLHSF